MTTQELIDTYQLDFKNKKIQYHPDPANVVTKICKTSNILLTQFLFIWDDPEEITETMFPKLENVINGVTSKESSDADNIFVIMYPLLTHFYEDGLSTPAYTLPTQDYYDILQLWVTFLSETPIDDGNFV